MGPKIVPAPPTMVTSNISTDLSMPKAIDGSDVEIFLGIEGAAGGAHGARQGEDLHLLGEHVDAERAGGILVLTDGDQAGAEAAARQAPGNQQGVDPQTPARRSRSSSGPGTGS